jgi:hypothetical protein
MTEKAKAIIFDDGSNASAVLIDELSKDEEYNVLFKVGEFKSLGEWMKSMGTRTADNHQNIYISYMKIIVYLIKRI